MGSPAQPPQTPPPTPALEREEEARKAHLLERDGLERRSLVRGLLLLAFIVLFASMMRAGFGRVFIHRWWHP